MALKNLTIDLERIDVRQVVTQSTDFHGVESQLKRLARTLPTMSRQLWPVGYEHQLLRSPICGINPTAPPLDGTGLAGLEFCEGPIVSRYLQRQAPELAAYHLWGFIKNRTINIENLKHTSRLLGAPGVVRTSESYTTRFPSGHITRFVGPHSLNTRVSCLLKVINSTAGFNSPLQRAMYIYSETLICHPLTDGNGRLARLLFQIPFVQEYGLTGPVIPLGVTYATTRRRGIYSLLLLSTGSSSRLASYISESVDLLAHIALRRLTKYK